jgi:hypothetical protein
MIRLLVAAMCLTFAAAPAFACDLEKSASTDTQKRAVASQPSDNHSTPQPNKTPDEKSS